MQPEATFSSSTNRTEPRFGLRFRDGPFRCLRISNWHLYLRMFQGETSPRSRRTFEPGWKRKFEVPSSELKGSRLNTQPTMRLSPSPRQYRASCATLWPLSRAADCQRNRKSRIDYRLSAPYDSNRICRRERWSLRRRFPVFITSSGDRKSV